MLSVMLLSLITLTLFAQEERAVASCVNDKMAESIRNDIFVVLRESHGGENDFVRLKEHFSTLDFSAYHVAFSFVKDSGLRCDQIDEYSILECYEGHELLRYIYMVVKDVKGVYHVSKYNCSLGKGMYLGDMKRNYFSKMFEFISVNPPIQSEETNYILLIRFTNEKVVKVELETGVTLWTMNQLFLLEGALFDY